MALNLSPREIEICKFLVHGLKNEEIAKLLNVSKHTVKAYISTMLCNKNVRNRIELAYLLGKEKFNVT